MMLGVVIADWRFANHIGVREAATRIGISAATLSRIERGKNCDARSLTKIVLWLFGEFRWERKS